MDNISIQSENYRTKKSKTNAYHMNRSYNRFPADVIPEPRNYNPVIEDIAYRKVTIKGSGILKNSSRNNPAIDHRDMEIIPQDEDWGENRSDKTTNTTTDTAYSVIPDTTSVIHGNYERFDSKGSFFSNMYGSLFTILVALIVFSLGFISPVVMIIIPVLNIVDDWVFEEYCSNTCYGIYISTTAKIFLAFIGTWAIFLRNKPAIMPRNFTLRTILVTLSLSISGIFWFVYIVFLMNITITNFGDIVSYSGQLLDTQLFLHYIAVIMLEIRQIRPKYSVEILRSPDGERKSYVVGQLTIQRMAVYLLQLYHNDFTGYNPHLERYAKKRAKLSTFKVYGDIDRNTQNNDVDELNSISNGFNSNKRKLNRSKYDRYYEEIDYERRVQRRRIRLITATEQSFLSVRKLNNDMSPPLSPREAAEVVFASLGNHLKKYLRITRQQQKYNINSILEYLALCLSYDMGPKAFVDRYLNQGSVVYNTYTITNNLSQQLSKHHMGITLLDINGNKTPVINKSNIGKERSIRESWKIICKDDINIPIKHGTVFKLKQSNVSLLITCRSIPQFYINEQHITAQDNLFTLVVDSETSI